MVRELIFERFGVTLGSLGAPNIIPKRFQDAFVFLSAKMVMGAIPGRKKRNGRK